MKNVRPLIFFLSLYFALSANTYSQQDPQYTMYNFDQLTFNPATAGSRGVITTTMHGRIQFNGLKLAPITWAFGMDIPFNLSKNKMNGLGIGISSYGSYVGFMQDHGLRFSMCYRRMKLGPGDLSVGIDIGLATKALVNPVWITPGDTNDPGIPPSKAAGDAFDMGAGVYYAADQFYAGVSVSHLTAPPFPSLNYRLAPHMYVNGGGFIPVGTNQKWRLNPNAMVRTDFVTMNFDVGLNAICYVKENYGISFGASYRFVDAVSVNVGYALRDSKRKGGMFMIGYSFDLITSHLNSFATTSHELVLRYCFPERTSKLHRLFY